MNSTATSIDILPKSYPARKNIARGRRSLSVDAANDFFAADNVVAFPSRNVQKRWPPISIRNGRLHVSAPSKPRAHDLNNPYRHLVDTIEPRLIPAGEYVFATLSYYDENGDWRDRRYRTDQTVTKYDVDDRAKALSERDFDADLYQSQFFFHKFGRSKRHVWGMSVLWAEMDWYKVPGMAGLTNDQALAVIFDAIRDECLPEPSYVVFSEQGFHVKWLLNQVLPKRATGLVEAMLKHIQKRLAHVGADDKAIDLCRVLRIPGSLHTETGNRVRVMWENRDANGDIVRHDPEFLRDEILPESKADNHARRAVAAQNAKERKNRLRREKRRKAKTAALHVLGQERDRRDEENTPKPRGMHIRGWAFGVLQDLDTLILNRWQGSIPSGHQDIVAHIAGCQLAQLYPTDQLLEQIRMWVRGKFAGWTDGELDSVQSTLVEKAMAAARGEAVEWQGQKVTPVYTYKKKRMIDLLSLTPSEQREMQCLISDDEKNRRRRVKRESERRAAGKPNREEYEAPAKANRLRVVELREAGMSWRKIAAEIGISQTQVRRLSETASEPQVSAVSDATALGVPGCGLHLSCDVLHMGLNRSEERSAEGAESDSVSSRHIDQSRRDAVPVQTGLTDKMLSVDTERKPTKTRSTIRHPVTGEVAQFSASGMESYVETVPF